MVDEPEPIGQTENAGIENNTSTTELVQNQQEVVRREPRSQPISRPSNNKRRKINDDLTTDVLATVRDHFKAPQTQLDRFDLLGKTVSIKLRSVDKTQALIAEKIITDILFEAEMGTLTRASAYNYNVHYNSPASHSSIVTLCPTPLVNNYPNNFSSASQSPNVTPRATPSPNFSASQSPNVTPCPTPSPNFSAPSQNLEETVLNNSAASFVSTYDCTINDDYYYKY